MPGAHVVPGTCLEALAVEMKFTAVEWRVIALVLANQPISARRVAKALHLQYSHVKRAARELVRWNILSLSPEGLRFQPPPARWEPPVVPVRGVGGRGKPSKKPEAAPVRESEEEVRLTW